MARFDLLVPTCEEVFWLAAAAARDGWSDRLFAPSHEVLRSLHSKVDFPGLAQAAGIDAPATIPVACRADLDRLSGMLPNLVLKPEFSRFGSRVLVGPLASDLAKITPSLKRRWVAQERIEGEEVCVWSVARAGVLVACVVYRPMLRHGRAASYAFEAVDMPGVVGMARQIARAVGCNGQLSYDVIVTPSGRVAPVECNPRAVSGLHLLDATPALAHAILDGKNCPPAPAGTIRYLAPAMLLMGLPAAIAGQTVPQLLRTWRAGRDAVSHPGDRLPFAGTVMDAARFAAVSLTRRLSPTGATTDDIEWNGEDMV